MRIAIFLTYYCIKVNPFSAKSHTIEIFIAIAQCSGTGTQGANSCQLNPTHIAPSHLQQSCVTCHHSNHQKSIIRRVT